MATEQKLKAASSSEQQQTVSPSELVPHLEPTVVEGQTVKETDRAKICICVGDYENNEFQEGQFLEATIVAVKKKYKQAEIVIGDTLQRLTLQIEGYSPKDAYKEAHRRGVDFHNRHDALFRKHGIDVSYWDSWIFQDTLLTPDKKCLKDDKNIDRVVNATSELEYDDMLRTDYMESRISLQKKYEETLGEIHKGIRLVVVNRVSKLADKESRKELKNTNFDDKIANILCTAYVLQEVPVFAMWHDADIVVSKKNTMLLDKLWEALKRSRYVNGTGWVSVDFPKNAVKMAKSSSAKHIRRSPDEPDSSRRNTYPPVEILRRQDGGVYYSDTQQTTQSAPTTPASSPPGTPPNQGESDNSKLEKRKVEEASKSRVDAASHASSEAKQSNENVAPLSAAEQIPLPAPSSLRKPAGVGGAAQELFLVAFDMYLRTDDPRIKAEVTFFTAAIISNLSPRNPPRVSFWDQRPVNGATTTTERSTASNDSKGEAPPAASSPSPSPSPKGSLTATLIKK